MLQAIKRMTAPFSYGIIPDNNQPLTCQIFSPIITISCIHNCIFSKPDSLDAKTLTNLSINAAESTDEVVSV